MRRAICRRVGRESLRAMHLAIRRGLKGLKPVLTRAAAGLDSWLSCCASFKNVFQHNTVCKTCIDQKLQRFLHKTELSQKAL